MDETRQTQSDAELMAYPKLWWNEMILKWFLVVCPRFLVGGQPA